MLPNIDQTLYAKFKKYTPVGGYRIKKYEVEPVTKITEIVQLGYLDVNRTLTGIEPEHSLSLKQTVISFIEDLLARPPKTQQDFDLLHHKCCEKCLHASLKGKAQIHYGQAQKLLNMSLKYLYNEYAAYKGKLNQFKYPDNNIEHLFHLPIDNQILNYLIINCGFIRPTLLPWSQWEYKDYINFQSQLRDYINDKYRPLEIDYMLWNTKGASAGNAVRLRNTS